MRKKNLNSGFQGKHIITFSQTIGIRKESQHGCILKYLPSTKTRACPKPVEAGLEHRASKFWGPVIYFFYNITPKNINYIEIMLDYIQSCSHDLVVKLTVICCVVYGSTPIRLIFV